ncbi:MAG: discoidin domain-containing protein [Sedimentisphaerales bacterium]|nr:discoidin domain-containing protein [Sedimentisphaerales bacterium]
MRFRSYLTYCVLLLIAVLAQTGWTDVTVTTADGQGADTWVNYFHQTTNYGTDFGFYLSKNYVGYMRFDLSGIGDSPVINSTETLLSFYGSPDPNQSPGFNDTLTIYGLADGCDDWDEMTLTYANAPHIANPVSDHPSLTKLGTVSYTDDDEGLIELVPEGTAMVDFLNNRGPDGLVTIIIASERFDAGYYFSTKEDHGDASEAPFLVVKTGTGSIIHNNWVGNTSNNWDVADNWLNEDSLPDVPDVNDVAYLASGTNYPVVVNSTVIAGKLFVATGGLELVSGSLTLSSPVVAVADGVTIDITGGELRIDADARGLIGALIDDGKIVTSNAGEEPCAVYEGGQTIVGTRTAVPYLHWGIEIVSADGPTGSSSDPAENCVNHSGISGDYHARYHAYSNSWYAKDIGYLTEPCLVLEFDHVYELTDMWVWNYEDSLKGYAWKQVRIEYSTDGVNYYTLMNGMLDEWTFAMGAKDGSATDVIPFAGTPVRYLRMGAVGGPGVGNYGVIDRYILRELRFYHQGMWDSPIATEPEPGLDTEVNIDADLSWVPGDGAVTGQDVWFGTTAGGMVKIGDNIGAWVNSFALSYLDNEQDYYWRIDGRNGAVVTTGDVWHFTARARLIYPDGGIISATESRAAWGNSGTYGSHRTVDGSGMDGDVHEVAAAPAGTYWYARQDINHPEYPDYEGTALNAWAQFDFDDVYYLDELWVWNCDAAESTSDRAFKRVQIEYSALDNPDPEEPNDWTTLMDGANPYFIWTKGANGEHSDEVLFGNVPARHIRISSIGGIGVGNYGSLWGYWLNELRFYYNTSPQATAPSPSNGAIANIDAQLRWRPGSGGVTGQDVWFGPAGGPLVKVGDNIGPDVTTFSVELDNLQDYAWRIDGRDGAIVTTGNEWEFSTKAWLRWNPGGEGVVAGFGSEGDGGTPGDRAVNESGIYNEHLHASFSWSNSWYHRYPATLDEPPLDIEFDKPYQLTEMWVWNHDGTTSTEAAIAIQRLKVEYSLDGTNYTTVMDGANPYFVLPHGNTDGTHDTVIDFGGVVARYVRLTPVGGIGLGNYGSVYGYKLREVRFFYKRLGESDISGIEGIPDGTVGVQDLVRLGADWLHIESEVTGELSVDDFESGLGNWLILDPGSQNTTTISVETSIVHSGSQSMRVDYDQTAVEENPTCWVLCALPGGSVDLSDYDRLEIWQYNAEGNAPVTYRQIEFGAQSGLDIESLGIISADEDCGTYADQMVTPSQQWFLWSIEIPTLIRPNLTSVDGFVIRADHVPEGSNAGTSTVYYDDIRFVKDHCAADPVGDINGDCASDISDFAVMSSEWLQDSN